MMAVASPCPPTNRLRDLALGYTSDEEIAVFESHLLACSSCAVAIRSVAPADRLVEVMRHASSAALPRGRAIDNAVQRACRLPSAPAPRGAGETDASIHETTGRKPLAPSELKLLLSQVLSPPGGPDELGRLGPYRVLKLLSIGGMGLLFLANDPQLERRVALKAMLPGLAASADARARFSREARAAAALRHDNIVTIYHVGEDRGTQWLAMELLAGEPLDRRLFRAGALPFPEIARIGRQVTEALAAAHAQGLIHRDIKPANIWIEAPSGRVKVLDFGLARAACDETELTRAGDILGTPAYMSPEQAKSLPADPRSDLFSLGSVLYHLLTGEAPFSGKDTLAVVLAVAEQTPPPLVETRPDVPAELAGLVNRLLSKDPRGRPQTAAEVARELAEIETTLSSAGDLPAEAAEGVPERSTELKSERAASASDIVIVAPSRASAFRSANSRTRRRARPALAVVAASLVVLAALAAISRPASTRQAALSSTQLEPRPQPQAVAPVAAMAPSTTRPEPSDELPAEPAQGDRPQREPATAVASPPSPTPPPSSPPAAVAPQRSTAAVESTATSASPAAALANATAARPPGTGVLISAVTSAPVRTVLGEITRETDTHVEISDLRTAQAQVFEKTELQRLRRDVSERTAIDSVGLADYLAWRIKKVLPLATTGKIAQLEGPLVFTTLGRATVVAPGQELVVYRGDREITDPDTGKVLGRQRRKIALLQVTEVAGESLSKARLLGELETQLQIGDEVEAAVVNDAVAVFPLVNAAGEETVVSRRLAEELTTGLVNRGVRVVERRLLDTVLGELGRQESDRFDSARAQQAGKQLGAYGIVVGTISPKNKLAEAQLRFVRVESGEVVLAASQTIRDAATAVVATPNPLVHKPPAARRSIARLPEDTVAFAGKHYKIFTERLTWHEAKARCEGLGGHLCIVRSLAENQFLARELKAHNLHLAYIGATDEKVKGEWHWIDGTRVEYSNWAPSQPNNYRGIERYAAIMGEYLGQWHDGKWHDQPDQSDVFPGFICQWD